MSLLTIPINELLNLGQDRSVDFFRRLLWAESASLGIAKSLIDIPDCINVGDGGIDAYIKDASYSKSSFIPKGNSGYQIKSADLSPKDCKSELHEENDLTKPLKPEIKRTLENDGIYILVLFADLSKKQRTNRETALEDEFCRNISCACGLV